MKTEQATPGELAAAFHYNPRTGVITRTTGERRGRSVGHDSVRGYRTVTFRGKGYGAHRVAWALTHGEWPTHQIDHINGIRSDNRLVNLRDATPAANSQNKREAYRNSRTGSQGVTLMGYGAFLSRIFRNGKRVYIGVFDTQEEAAAAYRAKKLELDGPDQIDLDGSVGPSSGSMLPTGTDLWPIPGELWGISESPPTPQTSLSP
jgi:hypothetical protein